MANAKKPGSRAALAFAIAVVLLTLVGAGSGLAIGLFLLDGSVPQSVAGAAAGTPAPPVPAVELAAQGEGKGAKSEQRQAENTSAEEAIDPLKLKAVAFPPVLTTLAEPKGKWIRLEGSILCLGNSDTPLEILAEKAGEQILAYLRTVRLDQLEGPSGLFALKEDIDETVRTLSNGEVREVLIHGLIVE